jgi:hypothetical protein
VGAEGEDPLRPVSVFEEGEPPHFSPLLPPADGAEFPPFQTSHGTRPCE